MIRYSWSIFFLPIPLAMVSKLASIGSPLPGSKKKSKRATDLSSMVLY